MIDPKDLDPKERQRRLEEMKRSMLSELAEGIGRVNRLEQPLGSLKELDATIDAEIARYGGRRVELEE